MRTLFRFCIRLLALAPAFGNASFGQRANLFGDINLAFQAANGRFVAAEREGAKPLVANRKDYGSYETFRLIRLDGDLVGLQATVNNRFVTAGPPSGDEPLIADREYLRSWETFEWIRLDSGRCALKALNGRYVRLGKDGRLYADGRTIDEESTLRFVELPAMALRSRSGRFLTLDTATSEVRATAWEVGRTERFSLTVIEQGQVVLRAVNGRFVRVTAEGAFANARHYVDGTAFHFQREVEGKEDRLLLKLPKSDIYLMADGGGYGPVVIAKRYDPLWTRFRVKPETMEPELRPLVLESALYRGSVQDSLTGVPLAGAQVVVQDLQNELPIRTYRPDDTGDFRISLYTGHRYEITVKSDDHLYYAERLDVPKGYTKEIDREIRLPPVREGMRLGIAGVAFDTDTTTLRPDARPAVKRLADLMRDNPTLRIEVRAYGSGLPTEVDNRRLAEGRARAIVNALADRGVDRERMQYAGVVGLPPEDREEAAEFRVLGR